MDNVRTTPTGTNFRLASATSIFCNSMAMARFSNIGAVRR